MKSQISQSGKLEVKIDKRLNNIDVTQLFPERLAEANRTLKDLRMPDLYYQEIIDNYSSQKLRDALNQNQSGTVLNEIVRTLAAENPHLSL